MTLDAIKARLGSVAPLTRRCFPRSVQRLLDEDMPKLIEISRQAKRARDTFLPALLHGDLEHQAWLRSEVESRFSAFDVAFQTLEAPCPE